ncbi:MAG: mechanosensitive ion channel [Candidatus Pacebacteria bacterium]|nr:mechanosensitive ion channel [Candidatus Paceibacterota bacterium]
MTDQLLLLLSQKAIKIILLVLGGEIAKQTIPFTIIKISRLPGKLHQQTTPKQLQRVKTLRRLTISTVKLTVNFIIFIMTLSEVGLNIAPLLAGAGILGLAVGFGAKSLVADLIAGFFIILENQFNVGDLVQIANQEGRVKKITLRTVILKDKERKTYIIPNSAIKAVIKLPPGKRRRKAPVKI